VRRPGPDRVSRRSQVRGGAAARPVGSTAQAVAEVMPLAPAGRVLEDGRPLGRPSAWWFGHGEPGDGIGLPSGADLDAEPPHHRSIESAVGRRGIAREIPDGDHERPPATTPSDRIDEKTSATARDLGASAACEPEDEDLVVGDGFAGWRGSCTHPGGDRQPCPCRLPSPAPRPSRGP